MPKYLEPEKMFDLLRQAYDERYYQHVYGLQAYQLGERYSMAAVGAYAPIGEFPDYPLIVPRRLRVGESRRILSNQVLTLMKVAYMIPELTFPDVDPLTEMMRQGVARELWTSEGSHESSEWSHEAHDTFMDGDGLGMGWTRIGVDDGQVYIQHHRLVDVIWDRLASNPSRSDYVAWIHHMPVDKAVEMFGSQVQNEATLFGGTDSGYESKLQRVKVIEWRDVGIGKANPTCTYFLNQIGGKVLYVGPNDYECTNGAFYTHIKVPGMERAIGRIDMQLGNQEFRNALERLIKLTLQRGSGFDLIDPKGMDPADLAKVLGGQTLSVIRKTAEDGRPVSDGVLRVPPQQIEAGIFNMLQYVDRELAAESGNSDADRANLSLDKRTLGENVMAKEGADIQTAWSRRQYAAYQQRLWRKVFQIAGKFHTKPITVDISGTKYTLNNPQDPRSALSDWLSEHSRIIINEDALQYQDASIKAQQQFNMWRPLMGVPNINQIELLKKMLTGMGVKDIDNLIDPSGHGGMAPPAMPPGASPALSQGQMAS